MLSREAQRVLPEAVEAVLTQAKPLAEKRRDNRRAFFASVKSIVLDKTRRLSTAERSTAARALVAQLALRLPSTVPAMNLPGSILQLYPESIDRLAGFLVRDRAETYEPSSDFFQKDIAFALGISVPCGAQVVDLTAFFRGRSVLRALTRSGNSSGVARLLLSGGRGPWFAIHTESRFLTDFNETGWEACYARIADLLRRRTGICGMIGTSWFYDPQLLVMSPRLAYLQQRPQERGAFLIRHGTTAIDIERATLTSPTRRALYAEGKYRPVSYTLVWPRDALLAWADSAA